MKQNNNLQDTQLTPKPPRRGKGFLRNTAINIAQDFVNAGNPFNPGSHIFGSVVDGVAMEGVGRMSKRKGIEPTATEILDEMYFEKVAAFGGLKRGVQLITGSEKGKISKRIRGLNSEVEALAKAKKDKGLLGALDFKKSKQIRQKNKEIRDLTAKFDAEGKRVGTTRLGVGGVVGAGGYAAYKKKKYGRVFPEKQQKTEEYPESTFY